MRRGTCIFDVLAGDRREGLGLRASFLGLLSSETAADVETFFSVSDTISASAIVVVVTGFSDGNLRSSESRWWWLSRSLRVRRASWLPVWSAALANSPAARVCSLMATVVSEV
jgi:hypothetical protein